MKYLVYEQGIEKFRQLVETYFGKKIETWRPLPEWQYHDWMGWHEQGDDEGHLFLGINVESGRVRNNMGPNQDIHYKKAFREIGMCPLSLLPLYCLSCPVLSYPIME